MAYFSSHLQLDAQAAGRGLKGTAGIAAACRCENDDECLHPGSERTEAGSPFPRRANGAWLAGSERKMSQLDIYGHARRGKVCKVSWLMVGAIGFEPMTSTV